MSLSKEKVAIVGRNGVGKSTLLHVLAGVGAATSGTICARGTRRFVAQELDLDVRRVLDLWTAQKRRSVQFADDELRTVGLPSLATMQEQGKLSPGECRKLSLLAAKHSGAKLLLLDEPTQDLDAGGRAWLGRWLRAWPGALLVATHDEALLASFEHFFVIAESGCQYVPGSYAQLQAWLEEQGSRTERRYLRNLAMLERREEHSAIVARRRRRKKMGGRVREIDRAPSRAMLNNKRSYAQESQGKREKVQAARISATRAWAKATRRALTVSLALAPVVPALPPDEGALNLDLHKVSLRRAGKLLVDDLSLEIGRERIALLGPNGAGKTSLLEVMSGKRKPTRGRVRRRDRRTATITQGALGWESGESLLSRLVTTSHQLSPDEVAARLVSHKFPLALATRPASSLSPGERVRAALLCIFEQLPAVELILLDEPTYCLDQVGHQALREILFQYRGGLVVASHDTSFLRSIGVTQEVSLGPHQGRGLRPIRE
jgi:ATPase subunit of ABC transporter with duplicated ATPase domains